MTTFSLFLIFLPRRLRPAMAGVFFVGLGSAGVWRRCGVWRKK
nr:MAG TPA: hypothetical protein [Caudoviricetes sp.]